jgi:hypothetical protein
MTKGGKSPMNKNIEVETLYLAIKFPGMNEMIAAAKKSPYAYSAMKKKFTQIVAWEAKIHLTKRKNASFIFKWYEENNRRDPDNVAAAKKFVLDGLVMAEIIPKDTRKCVLGWEEIVIYKQKRRGVEITLM